MGDGEIHMMGTPVPAFESMEFERGINTASASSYLPQTYLLFSNWIIIALRLNAKHKSALSEPKYY